MGQLETIPLVAEKPDEANACRLPAEEKVWKPSAIVADIATLGTGTLLAGLFNAALVFVVPRLITVEDFGYWRLFGLYAGYVGFLHFGFADGVLLRWAGRPMEEFHHEIGPALKYLFWQHVIVLAPLCAIAALVLPGPLQFVGIALAIFALIFNLVAILHYALQSARIFRPVAIAAVAAPALFLVLALLWRYKWQSGYRDVTSFYAAGWLIVLVFLLLWTKPWSGERRVARVKDLAKQCVLSGWPIMLANTGVMVATYADRLAVSWTATIQDFAQYSLAASAMAVPITAIQACSRVFFPHLAGVTAKDREQICATSSRVLLIAWTILLPYFFVLDVFVRHFLPRYTPSLQYARILLLGIPFLAAIQILHMSYAYLNGIQKQFLGMTMGALAVSIGVTSFAAFHTRSLGVVAGVQVAILGVWWLVNELTLRGRTGQRPGEWARFAAVYLLVGTAYWVTSGPGTTFGVSVGFYYLMVALIIGLACRDELRLLLGELAGRNGAVTER